MIPVYIEIDSKFGRQCKAAHLRRRRWESLDKSTTSTPIIERIIDALEGFDAGNFAEWPNLTYWLSADQESGNLLTWPNSIESTPGWLTCDEMQRQRIMGAGIRYLSKAETPSDDWFGKGTYSWKIISISLALKLVLNNSNLTAQIPNDAFVRWIPHMVDLPFKTESNEYCLLFNIAYSSVPEKTKDYLLRLMDSKDEKDGRINFIHHLEKCWPDELDNTIIRRIKKGTLKPGSFANLMEFLLKKEVVGVEDIICEYLNSPHTQDSDNDEFVMHSAVLAWEYFGDKYWQFIWNILNARHDLADKILLSIRSLSGRHAGKILYGHSEAHLADLYKYMSNRFPHEEDPDKEGYHEMLPRELLADFRSSLLRFLANRGTEASCEAIETLMHDLPNQRPYLLWTLREAQVNALTKTWMPPAVGDIVTLLQNNRRRYVESEEQLLSTIASAIERMQAYYKGELAPVKRFWNDGKNQQNFRPKDEENLSDEVAIWLRDTLTPNSAVVVNREVQVQRGQKTDIRIDAIKTDKSGAQVMTVIIEVKGCWNQELMTAMESQLVEEYMKANAYKCGLYLVGWFTSDKWEDGDRRKKTGGCKTSREELSRALTEQAELLCSQYHFIGRLRSVVMDLSL